MLHIDQTSPPVYPILVDTMRKPNPTRVVLMIAMLLPSAGCGDLIPPRPPIHRDLSPEAPMPPGGDDRRVTATGEEPVLVEEPFEGDWSEWYVHRFGSQVVGVSEVVAKSELNLRELLAEPTEVTYRRNEQLVFRSGSVSFRRRFDVTSHEKPDGSLIKIESESNAGPIVMKTAATAGNGSLSLQTFGGGTQNQNRLEMPPTTRGLFALEQTLRRRPIESGETRRLTVLLPTFDSIGVFELHCNGQASVAMLDGEYRLLSEVDVMTFRDGERVDSMVVWVDDQGRIEKSLRPDIRLETFRTDRTTARTLFDPSDADTVRVGVTGTLRQDADPTRVAFVVTDGRLEGQAEEGSEDEAFGERTVPAVANQAVRQNESGVQVLVTSGPESRPGFKSDGDAFDESAARPGKWVDSDDRVVSRMASSVGELPTKDLAVELARLVQNSLSRIPQAALRPASAIIRSASGGEVDHAIVLAALLRSRAIPARVAIGLVLPPKTAAATEGRTAMRLTAWVVASIDDERVSVDPMTGRLNAVDRLCLSLPAGEDDLEAALASSFRRLTDLKIEIRGAEYE